MFKCLVLVRLLMTGLVLMGQQAAVAQVNTAWSVDFGGIGTHSSPRAADLNGDGVKDIVIGCGKKEFQPLDNGIIALDGASGKVLWQVPARDQVYGSATFLDVNRDGTPDVIIGGRAAELKAINGKNGKVLWAFFPKGNSMEPRKKGWFNFYNAQVVPDQNADGVNDLLVSNGGDILAAPFSPDRPAGHLLVLDASNGNILADAKMPDGKEIYMSVVVAKMSAADPDLTIVYGTGGETIGGHLYRTTLQALMKHDISASIVLDSQAAKGFIAPPVLADVNRDGTLDIIDNEVAGQVVAIDGKTNRQLWRTAIPGTEVYSSLGVGYFNNDSVPDFFTTFTQGVWPLLNDSKQMMLDGKTGNIEFLDSLGILQTSSPAIADLNNDGFDDGLISVNYVVMEKEIIKTYMSMLAVYDFHRQSTYQLQTEEPGINLSSSPWLGDLDNDGYLELVYCVMTDKRSETSMNGFRIKRVNLNIKAARPVIWGSYMGSDHNGIFRPPIKN